MKQNNIALTGLLLLQVVLTAALVSRDDALSAQADRSALLSFDAPSIDRIELTAGSRPDATLVLEKDGEGWQLGDSKFPADADKVQSLLDRLSGLEHGLAVATTADSAKRLKVAESSFERRIRLLDGKEVRSDLYLGSGAGARRSHLRRADSKAIYTAELQNYQVPTETADWQDKSVLRFAVEEVKSAQIGELVVRKTPAQAETSTSGSDAATNNADHTKDPQPQATKWTAEQLADGEQFDPTAFRQQLNRLSNLRFTEARPATELPERDAANAFTVKFNDGKERSYNVYPIFPENAENATGEDSTPPKPNAYHLKVSDHEAIFVLPSSDGRQLVENWTRDHLVETPDSETKPKSRASDQDGG